MIHFQRRARLALCAAVLAATPVGGQACEAAIAAPEPLELEAATPMLAEAPAGAVVVIAIDEPLSSKTATKGQRFRIRLAEPLLVDGAAVLAAGLTGEGEVIHVDGAKLGGKPGELLLAARFLDRDGARIPLKAFSLAAHGQDRLDAASIIAAAAGVASVYGGFASFIVVGGQIEVPAGTRATAKLSAPTPAAIPPTGGAPHFQSTTEEDAQ